MPKNGGLIIGTLIVLFCLGLATMVGAAALAKDDSAPTESFQGTLNTVEDEGLQATAISPADLFGQEWVAAGFICPGMNAQEIQGVFGVDPQKINMVNDQVPDSENYLVVMQEDGTQHVEKMSTHNVNLCTVPIGGFVDANIMLQMVKDDKDAWNLLVQ